MKRIGVIGLGLNNPYFYAPILKNLGAKVSMVWDYTVENATDYAKQFDCQVIEKIEDFPYHEIDGVLIDSVNSDHIRLAKPFLSRDIPVYIEKPLSSSPKEALHFLDQFSGACFFSSSPLRFSPPYIAMRDDIQKSGEDPVFCRVIILHTMKYFLSNPVKKWHDQPELSGGMLTDIGIHGIELLNMLKPGEIKEIDYTQTKAHYQSANCSDTHILNFRYADDSLAQLSLLCATEDLDYSAEVYTLNHSYINTRFLPYINPELYTNVNAYGGFDGTMQAFVRMIDTHKPPFSLSETYRNFSLLERIHSK